MPGGGLALPAMETREIAPRRRSRTRLVGAVISLLVLAFAIALIWTVIRYVFGFAFGIAGLTLKVFVGLAVLALALTVVGWLRVNVLKR